MNAIIMQTVNQANPSRMTLVGRYDAGDLQRAMRSVLSRKHSRIKGIRPSAIIIDDLINCDIRPDGRSVRL